MTEYTSTHTESVGRKVLVVEDNDFVRMQIVKFLADASYEIVEAKNGNEAFEKLKDDIDIAICDVRMEPMDGFDFIRAMDAKNIKTPVILVTGDSNPEMLSDASKLGVATVLIKPVQKDRLLKATERALVMAEKNAAKEGR